jgi:hypothetical protein
LRRDKSQWKRRPANSGTDTRAAASLPINCRHYTEVSIHCNEPLGHAAHSLFLVEFNSGSRVIAWRISRPMCVLHAMCVKMPRVLRDDCAFRGGFVRKAEMASAVLNLIL